MLRFQVHRTQSRTRTAGIARTVLINIAVLILLFVLAEGFLSAALLSSDLLGQDAPLERVHTRYDPELGWAAIPNLDLPDMYGPGGFLRTNSQGFRGNYDYTETVPAGKRRVICSGDSVTFGYGVDDEHAWCRLLETMDPRLETINMALPGYGVDQAFLWYKRDAARFQHQVHLFAPITDDFRRMQSTKFVGYGRPFLVVEDDGLAVTNVPVPAHSFQLPWWTEIRKHLWSLRSAEAVRRLRRSFSEGGEAGPAVPANRHANKLAADREAAIVASKLLQDLKALNEARGSILVVVYLPTLSDRGPDTAFWTRVVEAECETLGIPFVNLVTEFDRMPDDEAAQLYLLPDLGHFNRDGNAYVARLVYQRLTRLPEVSRVLFATDGPRSGTAGPHALNPVPVE